MRIQGALACLGILMLLLGAFGLGADTAQRKARAHITELCERGWITDARTCGK